MSVCMYVWLYVCVYVWLYLFYSQRENHDGACKKKCDYSSEE